MPLLKFLSTTHVSTVLQEKSRNTQHGDPACICRDPACVRVCMGPCIHACMKSGVCMHTCMEIHGDLARTWCEHGENPETRRVGIQCACIGMWQACEHETLRACMHAGPACACVHSWGPGANVDGDPACLHGGPGACMHGGDPVRVCGDPACARLCGGPACAWGSSGHGQEPVLRIKVWEPACEAFTMQKSSVEKKRPCSNCLPYSLQGHQECV